MGQIILLHRSCPAKAHKSGRIDFTGLYNNKNNKRLIEEGGDLLSVNAGTSLIRNGKRLLLYLQQVYNSLSQERLPSGSPLEILAWSSCHIGNKFCDQVSRSHDSHLQSATCPLSVGTSATAFSVDNGIWYQLLVQGQLSTLDKAS